VTSSEDGAAPDREVWIAAHATAGGGERTDLAQRIARSYQAAEQILPAADWAVVGWESALTAGREVDQELSRLVFRLQTQAIFELQRAEADPPEIWPRIDFLSRHCSSFTSAYSEPLLHVVLARAVAGMARWESAAIHLERAQAHWDDCDDELRAEILLIAGALSLGPGAPKAEPALRAVGRLLERSTGGH
jgi:hypothetical protein